MSVLRDASFRARVLAGHVRVRLTPTFTGHPPVVVACTHRTASSATYSAVRRALGYTVVKCHRLNPALMVPTRHLDGAVIGRGGMLCNHMHGDQVVHGSIVKPRREARFIMMVRDPVAVMASMAGLAATGARRWGPDPDTTPHWPACDPFMGAMTGWFEHDVKPALGWSLLDHPFDAERGAGTFQHGQWEILVLRADLADSEKSHELSQFLGVPGIDVRPLNSAAERGQSLGVERARAAIRKHPAVVDVAYAHPFSQLCFTPTQLSAMRGRWLGPAPSTVVPTPPG